MIVKEDLEEAKERMKSWWDHETTDRPTIAYNIPETPNSARALIASSALNYDLGKNWDGIDSVLDTFENNSDGLVWGGDCIPRYFPNYGPGAMAAVLGVTPEFKSGTIWFHRKTNVKDIVPLLENAKLNDNNEWYLRLKRTTEIAAKRGAKHNYCVAMTDLGGILDILVSFLGPQEIIIQMRRNPELIDTCRAIILEKYLKLYDELQNIINKYVDGCDTWLNLWCPKRYYTMQSDFCVMLNQKYFERFVLPDLKEQAEHMDHSIYHLDGPEQIRFLDDILKVVDGIQWVPGAKPGMPQDGADKWMPLYKKIQKAGKNIHMTILDCPVVPKVYKQLDPKGLFVYAVFITRSLAECYLPKFMGGNGGELVNNISKWTKDNNIERITRAMVKEYTMKNNIQISKSLESQIVRDLRKSREALSYIGRFEK
ncbi:hypothetical protein LCGC14_1346130 [marine sediment metagenome]|uniref:Uroporphyrinogen decarboxylase (URO-D) domain-containing protein n=1 Tax=marine sediment metagenome TaxID=412755 RepID=A0A0F9MT57_9ZZZZ|nr:MAG: hypothetical protein Lokiarch_30720 [Candidatus Lokiarchaeum sp. GC14_75]